MKSEWPTVALSDVCDVIGGGTPSKSVPSYYNGTIPWATVRDMRSNTVVTTEHRITKNAVKNSSTNVIPRGNVILATRVGLGKVCTVSQDTAINQDLRGVIPKDPKRLSSRFVFWWLKSMAPLIIAEGTGATVQGVKLPFIKSLPMPVPSSAEQQRIVTILDSAWTGISSAAINVETNRQNASTLFRAYLQALLNGSHKWPRVLLSDVAKDFGRGKSKHRPRNDPKLYGGEYPFIQTGDVRNSTQFVSKYTQTYNDAGLQQSKLWPRDTLCITIAANIAETGILNFAACFPDSVIGVVVDGTKANVKFIEYMLQSYKARLQAQGKGSAQDNINLRTFENQRFPLPSLRIQSEIVAHLDAMSNHVQRLESSYEQKVRAFDELKQSLLHQAFQRG